MVKKHYLSLQYKNIFAGVPLRCEPEHGMETIEESNYGNQCLRTQNLS